MRILIVGSDVNAYTLAEKISKNKNVDVVFVTSDNQNFSKNSVSINIPETDNAELLDFAIANEISLTIVTSIAAIENDIAVFFNEARRLIFAPAKDSAIAAFSRVFAKKIMYKLKIPTMKFGIFERENQALEYFSNYRKPLVIRADKYTNEDNCIFVSSFSKAKSEIEKLFISPENKIVVEDYIDEKEVTLYFLTDGYTALPIGSCSNYLDKDYSTYSVLSPDKYISDEMEFKILQETIYPVLDEISERSQAYCGILGIKIISDGTNYNVVEFLPFFKQTDMQSILPLIKSDLYDLFLSAASGSLSDEYEHIDFYNCISMSKNVKDIDTTKIDYIYDDDIFISYKNANENIVTQLGRTASRTRKNLENNIIFLSEESEDID